MVVAPADVKEDGWMLLARVERLERGGGGGARERHAQAVDCMQVGMGCVWVCVSVRGGLDETDYSRSRNGD